MIKIESINNPYYVPDTTPSSFLCYLQSSQHCDFPVLNIKKQLIEVISPKSQKEKTVQVGFTPGECKAQMHLLKDVIWL